mmetsp:Transcript_10255/g.42949  ORF Transcript_10255/g.42949 Transcript_10255/m.42949 type:complete len:249 (+) Transcript_10255:13-759(+)
MDISEERVDEVCPICLEHLKTLAVTFPCFHQFCTDCLKKWAEKKKRVPCPLCNKTLETFYHIEEGTGEVSVVNLQRRTPSQSEWRRKSRSSMIAEYLREMLEELPPGLGEEHIWRRLVYEERLYALGITQCIDRRAYHCGRIVVVLDRNLREWIRRDLQAIFLTPHVEETQKAVLKNLWHGIGRDELVRKLRSLLGDHAKLFVHELTWFSASRTSPAVYDNMACYPTRRSRSTRPRPHVDIFVCDVSR